MAEVKKVVIRIGERDIEFTPEEARDLKKALDDLFGKVMEKVKEKEYVPYPVYPWGYPYRYTWPYYDPWITTCGGISSGMGDYCGTTTDGVGWSTNTAGSTQYINVGTVGTA